MRSNTKSPVWITYPAPNLRAHRFYTVKQLQLDLVSRAENTNLSNSAVQLNALVAANPTPLEPPGARNFPPMDVVLDHINISPTVDQLVQGTLKTSQLLVPAGLGQISSHATVAPPWSRLSNLTKDLVIIPLVFLAGVCNASMPISYSGSTLAKDISATLQQTDVRLEQLLNSKEQFEATRLERVQSVALSTARYINFFNCVWLIFNDVIIGIAVGGFICDNKDILSRLTLQLMQRYFVDSLSETLHWLNNWPVGLKLNTELSHFLCNSFATIIDYWSQVMHLAAPYFPFAIYCIGSSGVFGMTMILSLTSDFLSILTLHIYFCYLLATTVFARLLNLLGSLYNLFRGKRKNILRNRTDSWNYDMDQLLLGTILFTLVTFLLPTVTVYYLLFTLARLAIIGMQASLETILAFLNHFPLFALMLR
ncbi:phosphatidylinositol N-acetylglucosaminyltransferase subunit gpi1, partial [Ceratobasidium sp. 428]